MKGMKGEGRGDEEIGRRGMGWGFGHVMKTWCYRMIYGPRVGDVVIQNDGRGFCWLWILPRVLHGRITFCYSLMLVYPVVRYTVMVVWMPKSRRSFSRSTMFMLLAALSQLPSGVKVILPIELVSKIMPLER